jgi:hypothetical protein
MAVFGGTIKGGKISSGGSGRFRARTGSTPVKKKEKTLFGLKIGEPPKSDVQKKIDSGQATVIATRQLDSGKSLISTNKQTGRITTKAEENQKIKAGSSPTAQGRPANFPKKFDNAGANFSDFMGTKSQKQKQLESKTGGTPLPSGLTGADTSTGTVKKTKLSLIGGGEKGGVSKIDTPKQNTQTQTGAINSGSLIYDFNKRMYGSYQGTALTERQFLKDKNTTTPTVSSLIGSIGSSVKNIGSWWRNAGDAQLKKNKQMNNVVKNQLGLSAGKSQF